MKHDTKDVSRRDFLQRLSTIGLAGVGGGVLLSACGGESQSQGNGEAASACSDLSALTESQQQQREQMVQALSYVEETQNPEQYCSNCALYTAPAQDAQCGSCQLFPGPVFPNGYCTSWAPAA